MLTCFHLLLSAVEWTRRELVEAGATGLVQPDFLLPAAPADQDDRADAERSGGLVEELCLTEQGVQRPLMGLERVSSLSQP